MALGSFSGFRLYQASISATVPAIEVEPDSVTTTNAFGTPVATLQVNGTGLASAVAFGTPVAKLELTATGFADADNFGTSVAKLQASNTGISDADAFGTPIGKLQVNATGLANSVALGTDNTFTTAKVREGLKKLLDAGHDYTDGETFFYTSPDLYMSLLSLGDFTEAQKRGDAANPLASGNIITAYGMPVFVSTDYDVDGGTGDEVATIFNRQSVYFAQQLAPRVQSSYDIDHLATSVVADVLFGAALSHAANSTAMGIVNFENP